MAERPPDPAPRRGHHPDATSRARMRPHARDAGPKSLNSPRWLRHLPWLIPTAACAVFLMLILGAIGVRKIYVLVSRPADVAQAPGTAESESPQGEVSAAQDAAIVTSPSHDLAGRSGISAEPPEPVLEILPPPAAIDPGRKLPRLLAVGDGADMFQSLEDAVRVAISGDIIEIRTSRPIVVTCAGIWRKEKIQDGPLTIRAGKGYQPVLLLARINPHQPFFKAVNVDLHIQGIHFASAFPRGVFFATDHGSVTLKKCTFTRVSPNGGGELLACDNSGENPEPIQIRLEQCFLRGLYVSEINCFGPSTSVTLKQSGFIVGSTLSCRNWDERSSLVVQQCTFVQCQLLRLWLSERQWPAPRFALRVERSLFNAMQCCPNLVNTLGDVPESYKSGGPAGFEQFLKLLFREFSAGDNVSRFWDHWWANDARTLAARSPVLGELPEDDQTMVFGKKIEDIRGRLFGSGVTDQDRARAFEGLATVLPEDLHPSSTGVLAQRMRSGIRYGADPAQLPVPPPATLQPYDADSVILAEAEDLKVLRKSDDFPAYKVGSPAQSPLFLSGYHELSGDATKLGQWLELAIPIARPGTYAVRIHLAQAPQSGVIRFSLNGKPVGGEVDLYAPEVAPLPSLDLGTHQLPAGDAVLRIETVGTTQRAETPGYHFAVDCLILRPVEAPARPPGGTR